MSRKIFRRISVAGIFLFAAISSFAQEGAYSSYSPYSIFGVGDIFKQGSAHNRSMGGVGIAARDRRHINYLNPASVTARDTLSFMLDFGLSMENKIFSQGGMLSANNVLNINNIAFTFPIYRKSAFIVGLSPYSNVGYDFSYNVADLSVIGSTGNISYTANGNGSIYQLFAGGGATLWDRFSLGAQAVYYFGNIDKTTSMKFSDSGYRSFESGYKMELEAIGGRFGIQYEQPLKDMYLTIGATYNTSAKLGGYVTDYKYATISNLADTLKNKVDTLYGTGKASLAGKVGVGISLRKPEKWSFEINYLRSDWSRSGFNDVPGFSNSGSSHFSTTFSESVRAGFEYIPNRNDIRYYLRRCTYRGGVYYDKSYFKLDGNSVNSFGLTLGVTLPILNLYNGITLGVDLGQRGSTRGNMTRENYAMFVVGFNIHDLWFIKPLYD